MTTITETTSRLEQWLAALPSYWQLIAIATLTIVFYMLWRFLNARLIKRFAATKNLWDDAILHALNKPVSMAIIIIGFLFGLESVQNTYLDEPVISAEILSSLKRVLVVFAITLGLIRLINKVEASILDSDSNYQVKLDETGVLAVSKLLRLIVIVISTLIIFQLLNIPIAGVLTFGGIGGVAVGFAAKDLLANFFGGLMIFLDKPFKVGDWIRSPDKEIEGTVENIGWRQTRIRTFDKRPLYVPNATFTNISVENPSRMTNRRINESIGLRYDDWQKVETIVGKVKTMLQQHEEIDQTATLMVNFDKFAASSLDFFIYTFTKTRDWAEYHEIKQDVLLKIMNIIEQEGAEIAFPTSTLHMNTNVLEKSHES
ncbi:mechanosensitive ion channel family protein [Kangiella sp. HZ709]|uniref:mechanosensitive ion channel family protein n=1 Tax=Kangiella sp. HZ709 TaxID=2666328 RepID=UPI0012AFCF7F|nr:mechanosensitive ion channel family protein [Kangiella sp. HZ709]MRX26953.1 mechanosensitive ion channel [Kangiella sp. HZ709]